MYATNASPKRISINGNDDPFNRYKTTQLVLREFTRGGTKRTYLENIGDVAKQLHVAAEHLTYCIGTRLGSIVQEDKAGVYLCGHHAPDTVSDAISHYINSYVLCGECGAAELVLDTKPVGFRCSACGHFAPVTFDKKELKKLFADH